MATRHSSPNAYSESSIKVLKGLEPVRQRPGMYTRTESPLHIVQEVIDNSADEALGGHARSIDVTLLKDGTIAIEDDGRGIPVGMRPDEGVRAVVEIVFTRLHAGGGSTTGGQRLQLLRGTPRRRRVGDQCAVVTARSDGLAT